MPGTECHIQPSFNPWTRNSLPVLKFTIMRSYLSGAFVTQVVVYKMFRLWFSFGKTEWQLVPMLPDVLPTLHINLRPCMYQHHNEHKDLCYSCMTISLLQTISHDWQPSLYWFLNGCCFCRSTATHCHPTTDFISTKPNSCFGLCGEQSTALQYHMD